MGRLAELMTFQLTNTSEVVFTLGVLVGVADVIGNREHLRFLDASWEAHPLLGVDVLITKVIKVLYTQQ